MAKGIFALQQLEGATLPVSALKPHTDELGMNQNFYMEVLLKLHIHTPALNRT